jgi:excisionase family DNA binding protein
MTPTKKLAEREQQRCSRQRARKLAGPEQQRRSRQRALSIVEFCERYGLCRTKAYDELKSGRLRARKLGKRTLISIDDAENWFEQLPEMGGPQ